MKHCQKSCKNVIQVIYVRLVFKCLVSDEGYTNISSNNRDNVFHVTTDHGIRLHQSHFYRNMVKQNNHYYEQNIIIQLFLRMLKNPTEALQKNLSLTEKRGQWRILLAASIQIHRRIPPPKLKTELRFIARWQIKIKEIDSSRYDLSISIKFEVKKFKTKSFNRGFYFFVLSVSSSTACLEFHEKSN